MEKVSQIIIEMGNKSKLVQVFPVWSVLNDYFFVPTSRNKILGIARNGSTFLRGSKADFCEIFLRSDFLFEQPHLYVQIKIYVNSATHIWKSQVETSKSGRKMTISSFCKTHSISISWFIWSHFASQRKKGGQIDANEFVWIFHAC